MYITIITDWAVRINEKAIHEHSVMEILEVEQTPPDSGDLCSLIWRSDTNTATVHVCRASTISQESQKYRSINRKTGVKVFIPNRGC